MRRLILLALWLLLAGPAVAHVVESNARRDMAALWSFEPWVLFSLSAASLAYWAGLRRIRAVAGARIVSLGNVACFAAAILSLLVALCSPIDAIGADLFSMHMVQHLTLMLVAAPLMVWGRPWLVWLWAVGKRERKAIGRVWAGGRFGRACAWLANPIMVWTAFCGIFVFWHVPGPYGLALRHEGVHIFEHVTFFACSYAFWSVVMEPSGRRRLDYGATLLYVATAAVLSGLPGALIILTNRPFYPVHAEGVARWGLTLLEDQHLAGLIMWIPAGFVYLAAISALLVLWLREAERRAIRSGALPQTATLGLSAPQEFSGHLGSLHLRSAGSPGSHEADGGEEPQLCHHGC